MVLHPEVCLSQISSCRHLGVSSTDGGDVHLGPILAYLVRQRCVDCYCGLFPAVFPHLPNAFWTEGVIGGLLPLLLFVTLPNVDYGLLDAVLWLPVVVVPFPWGCACYVFAVLFRLDSCRPRELCVETPILLTGHVCAVSVQEHVAALAVVCGSMQQAEEGAITTKASQHLHS